MTLSSNESIMDTQNKEYLAGNTVDAIQQDAFIIEDIQHSNTITLKRTREDDIQDYLEDLINNKRLHTDEDTTPLFTVLSPELEIRFPDLETELFTPMNTKITDSAANSIAPDIEDWFLPNSPICEFDADPVSVPDSDYSYPSISELPYFEQVELQIPHDSDSNSINNSNTKELDNEDNQFWSLLVGEDGQS